MSPVVFPILASAIPASSASNVPRTSSSSSGEPFPAMTVTAWSVKSPLCLMPKSMHTTSPSSMTAPFWPAGECTITSFTDTQRPEGNPCLSRFVLYPKKAISSPSAATNSRAFFSRSAEFTPGFTIAASAATCCASLFPPARNIASSSGVFAIMRHVGSRVSFCGWILYRPHRLFHASPIRALQGSCTRE